MDRTERFYKIKELLRFTPERARWVEQEVNKMGQKYF